LACLLRRCPFDISFFLFFELFSFKNVRSFTAVVNGCFLFAPRMLIAFPHLDSIQRMETLSRGFYEPVFIASGAVGVGFFFFQSDWLDRLILIFVSFEFVRSKPEVLSTPCVVSS